MLNKPCNGFKKNASIPLSSGSGRNQRLDICKVHAFAFRGTVSPAQNKQAVHRHPTAIYGDVATRNQVGREERREWEGTQFFVVVVLQCIGTTHRRLATTPLLRVMFFRHHSPLVDLRGCTRKGRQVDAMWQVCLQGGVDSLTHKFDEAKTFYLNPTHIYILVL